MASVRDHREPLVDTGQVLEMSQRARRAEKKVINHANKKTASFFSRYTNRVFVNSKAASFLLLLNLLMSTLFGFIINPNLVSIFFFLYQLVYDLPSEIYTRTVLSIGSYAFFAVLVMFYPFAGYLADVKYGRHKVLQYSLLTTWTALLVAGLVMVIFVPAAALSEYTVQLAITAIVVGALMSIIIVLIGFGGFQANVIQFGLDQLQDAPAMDSSLYIHWFLLTFYTGITIGRISYGIFNCIYTLLSIGCLFCFVFLVAIPILLWVDQRNKKWFVPNPMTGNPYKLIRNVTSFARKHKIPIQRSAFTYWEDNIPTGLDLGKSKYGGPFTTEQVEEVKAFFGILKIILCIGPFFMTDVAATDILPLLSSHTHPTDGSAFSKVFLTCQITSFSGADLYPLFTAIGILIYIFLLQRCIQRFIPGMLKRIGIGLFLSTVSLLCSFLTDTTAHVTNNSTMCMFALDPYINKTAMSSLATHYNPFSIVILFQTSFTAVTYLLIYVGINEFICAQSPHSMKGFLIGISFATRGLFELFGSVLLLPLTFWDIDFPSCGMIYYVVNIIISIVGLIAFTYTAKKYQYRQRDEFFDERRYIEQVYENEVNRNYKGQRVNFRLYNDPQINSSEL